MSQDIHITEPSDYVGHDEISSYSDGVSNYREAAM